MVFILAACQPKVYLMPTPLVISSGEADPFAANPSLEQTTNIPVLYATNRLPVGSVDARSYAILPSEKLRLGIASLRIGKENKTWDKLYALSTTTKKDRRPLIQLKNLEELMVIGPDDNLAEMPPSAMKFFKIINSALESSLDKDLLIYVHGANNNFYRSTAQAAQYRHFTGRNSVVLSFAWPSAASLLKYGIDIINAKTTFPVFAHLVELLAHHTNARYLNILAYSAGAQIVSPGLAELSQTASGESREQLHSRLRLGSIYFAAPDADLKDFVDHLTHYSNLARRVTVSINVNDFVLSLAEGHHGISRAGRPNPDELSPEETRWIVDASNRLDLDLLDVNSEDIPGLDKGAHSFWYDNPWVSSDVLLMFLLQLSPAERGLQENRSQKGARYWRFPKDYPERVARIMREINSAN
jgi:esterase/lipase superfamily enzyme